MQAHTSRAPGDRSMASRHDTLLNTRLFVPPAHPALVERPRLIARIEEGLRRKLTLISAPAGSGKTTLLSSWRNTQAGAQWPLAWVSLTAGDNEVHRFWSYVMAALNNVEPGIGQEALAVLLPPKQSAVEQALTELINALSRFSRHFVVVLDDYHLIRNPQIHEAVGFLIEHMPPQMHVVIAGQEDPPLPLPRLRVRRQMAELRAADLRFTLDEAATFLNHAMGLNLAEFDIAAIEERTEGWIAGLQLAALSLQGREGAVDLPAALTSSHRFIVEYLASEVLHKQPESVQDFLLETSILDTFTAVLCDAVTGSHNGHAMLDLLERDNLFIVPLDGEYRWYRYHHLFGDFLRNHLRQVRGTRPDELTELHRRAAEWYEMEGMVDDAISHWIAGGDNRRAGELIEIYARAMFMRCQVGTVLSRVDALPSGLVRSRPQLSLIRAWALAHDYRLEEADRSLQDAEHLLSGDRETPGLSDAERTSLAGEIAAISARLASFRGQPATAIEISQRALSSLPPEYSFSRSEIALNLSIAYLDQEELDAAAGALHEAIAMCAATGNTRGVMYAVRNLGSLYVQRGWLRQAAALYREHLETPQSTGATAADGHSPPAGFVHAALSAVLLEWNDLDVALEHARQAIELGKLGGDGKVLLLGYAALVQAQQAGGDWAGALESAERLNRLSPSRYNASIRARVWLDQGNLQAAEAWARSSGIDPAADTVVTMEHENLTFARVLYAQGRIEQAMPLLEKMLARADRSGRCGSALGVRVWLTLCLLASQETERAVEVIAPALALAEAEGYVRTFLDAAPDVASLLAPGLDSGSPSASYVQRLLDALPGLEGRSQQAGERPAALPEPLSEREIDVLHLIEAGLSNEEIARRLVVTVGTVKTHLRNVYSKLDVHSRTQALARARALQLL